MPRPKQEAGGPVSAVRNTRKRGCSSSSSASSSLLQNSGFKRAILVGRRGGTSTPFPTWMMINARSPCSTAARVSECSQHGHSHASGKDKQEPVSARKLATALWELHEVSKPKMMGNLKEEKRAKTGVRGREDPVPRFAHWRSLPPHLSDPSHCPVSEATDKSRIGNHRRRVISVSQKLGLNEASDRALGFGCSDSVMEMETHSQDFTVTSSAIGVSWNRLKDLSSSLTTFKQLLKLLNHTWVLNDHHSSTVSLFPVLHSVLEQACIQVARLMEEQRSEGNKIDHLKRCFMEEKTAWRSMFQDRMKSAVQPLVDELKLERRLRRRTERHNRKTEMELTETKAALEDVRKALQTERRSREVIERTCHELVRGIGEDKAQLEQVKRESAMAREELEKEREMLQLADTWREQRVQMKLSEAKYHFEEKSAAIDQLRNELKACLHTNVLTDNNMGFVKHRNEQGIVGEGQLKHLGKHFTRIDASADGIREEGKVEDGEEAEGKDDEVNSTDSDLRSIELNMDNSSKSYRWSYAARSAQANGKVAPQPEEKSTQRSFLGRKNMSWGSFPLGKDVSEDTGWGFGDRHLPHLGEALHEDRPTYLVGNPGN